MNQEYFYSHSSGFDQFQPPQFSDAYQIPPVASMEMLHAQTDLIESMQSFLMKYDHIPHNEKSIKLLLAEEKFLKIKQVVEERQFQPELYSRIVVKCLLNDLQILNDITTQTRTLNQIHNDQEEKGDEHINITPETETISVETLVSNPSESNDFSLGECDLFDIEDSFYEKSTKEADLLSFSDNSITRGIESDRDSGEDTTSIDDLPLDDSMIFSEYESFTFDDEPVMAEVNVFDEINTSELSYPGIGENVVSDEEEDTFTFTTRTFLPFVTYPEVLPVSYSTGSEDKVFKPGIFDNDAFKDKSSKELAPSKALLTLDVFDPPHPPLMDFHDTKAFSGFTFSLLTIFSKKFVEPGIKNVLERIKKTKRSKNDKKPTRNERDKNKSEESAKDQSRISPIQQKRQSKEETMKSRDQL
ncbi:hypothetical protein Tco_0844131 [Tanacetum coccineum]